MINNSWNEFFADEEKKPYFQEMQRFLATIYSKEVVFPAFNDVFKPFNLTSFENVKVVIFGQDPYINDDEANGLAFSVKRGNKIPPSLRNIYKEIEHNVQYEITKDGDLKYLAAQGVLLLNPILTVKKGHSLSHDFPFYREFTINLILFLSKHKQSLVYMLWGNKAQAMKQFIKNKNHLVLEATHPSPLAANRGGFFYQNHFNKCNNYLKAQQLVPIVWGKKAK